MRATRRQFLVGAAAAAAVGCAAPPPGGGGGPVCSPPSIGGPLPLPAPGSPGLVDEAVFAARRSEYLGFATQQLRPTSATNVLAHLTRARLEPGFVWEPELVTPDLVDIDPFRDTDDFELMRLLWVLYLGKGIVPDETIAALEDAVVGFRYRYDDPLAADQVDNKWFWSENHRIIFAVDEYLGGLAVPDRVFTFTGLTGAQHAERARPVILEWIDERARFGFSEWHSNIYMKFNFAPLVTLVEFAPDVELQSPAAAAVDVTLFDLASHTLRGAYGVTQGRNKKSSKTSSLDETSFNTAKLLFDTADAPYQSFDDMGPIFFCASERYRMPEVIRRVANSDEVARVRERHGVPLDPKEPISLAPRAAYGYDYSDPDNLMFWWSHGALTAWQLIPSTLAAAKKWRLFDTELFQEYKAIEPLLDVGPAVAQIGVRELAPFAAAGVLGEAHTYTWRSPEVMLSCVVDHRAGDAMDEAHAWQATLDPQAVVFTTHPRRPVPVSTDWGRDTGYWTGTASMPRSAQRDRVGIHLYRPAYASPTDPLLGPLFSYQPFTHAFFPQDRFDEVVESGNWVLGRRGDGYVALYSGRPTQWRVYDPATEATDGMVRPFDLLAPGGADNAWIVEVGRAADHGSFAAFVDAITSAQVEVTRTGGHLSVRYVSPTEGELRFGTRGGFTVDGVDMPLRDHPRHSSPWAEQCHLGRGFDVQQGGARLQLDFTTGARRVS